VSDVRFNRLEEKVDKIDDKVDQINLELVEMKMEFKSQNQLIRSHVMGDEKIITALQPLIPQLKAMAEDYGFQKQKSLKRVKAFKQYGIYFGAFSATISVIGALIKIFNLV